jgi:hypothetical protein
MISLLHSRRSGFLFRNSLPLFLLCCFNGLAAQQLAAYHDNQKRFFIFDNGKTVQAEYLAVKDFSIGGTCLLYTDSRNNLKMYYQGEISTLEVSAPNKFEALDYLSVYNIGSIVKIIENGRSTTISTNAVKYLAEDSLVAFYDQNREMLAVYYKGKIMMLEDGLAGRPANLFKTGDNIVVYVSSRTRDLKVFYQGENRVLEPFLSGGNFKAGRDIVAWVNQSDLKFRIFYRGETYLAEEFAPESWQMGDGITAYVDNTGSFKLFERGETVDISSFPPDFYMVRNSLVIYGEQGYLKVWYNNRAYTLETFIPSDWKADWNTIVYRDLNRNVKVFSRGETKVLTYDLTEDIELYRDIVVVDKGMNNHNVYYKGKKY